MYYIYIQANKNNTVLYAGVTNDLKRRTYEHKEKLIPGFTARYKTNKLVYYEFVEDVEAAISREKQIKNYSRTRKIKMISGFNKKWIDLYSGL